MLHVVWPLLPGALAGTLTGWALAGPSATALAAGALAGGVVLAAVVGRIARRAADDPARRAHLAAAASAGLVALPGLGAALLRLAPGPAWWSAGTLAVLVAALARGARHRGPSGGFPRQLRAVAIALAGGALALIALAGCLASWRAQPLSFDARRAAAIFDMDARVVTRPLPRCGREPAAVRVLLERGAHPRLAPGGTHVWFDAAIRDGTRQVHRLDLSSGEIHCFTCDEPGHNARPAPGASGVVFETDRHAHLSDPTNTEIHLASTRLRDGVAPTPSRRLTFLAGPDDHALLGRSGNVLVWSRRQRGGFAVVSASIRAAHGGVSIGALRPLFAAGAAWAAPLAWSPDARSLVIARGNPFGPVEAFSIDLAADARFALGTAAPGGAADFNADGGVRAVASGRRAKAAARLPGRAGFLLAPFAVVLERGGPLLRGTELRLGETHREGTALELGAVAAWGEPTGVALAPDASWLVLGQRRRSEGAVEERLVEIALDCFES